MRDGLLVYGANGYTGRLIAKTFARARLRPTLAGRNGEQVKTVADSLGLPFDVFALEDTRALDAALANVVAVLHCAGPFAQTSKAMVEACLRTRTHYLDITGEIDVFEDCAARSGEAVAAGIMLLPGCGFDVVPSDCLAVHMSRRMPEAVALRLSISLPGAASPGTVATGAIQVARISRARRNGKIVDLPTPPRGTVDFGNGLRQTVGISWGDVSTAFHSTHIPNIDVEFEVTRQIAQMTSLPKFLRNLLGSRPGQSLMRTYVRRIKAAPDENGSPDAECVLLGEARDASGAVVRSRLQTKGAYWLTAQTTLLIAKKVLAGNAPVGFQTPALAYGEGLVMEVDGSSIDDLGQS